jgi:hypothetical protein
MSSPVIDTPRSAPRAHRITWWAAGLACGLHALVAWCLWREAGERPAMPWSSRQEAAFFVDVLPAEPARREALPAAAPPAQPAAAQEPGASAEPARSQASARPQEPASRQAPPKRLPAAPAIPSRQQATPASPNASSSTAKPSSAPAAVSPHDFRWRGEDAAAQGAPRARGQARVDLAPKPRAEPSALAKGIAQSARPPCRDAHAHLGLLALPLLLADSVRDDGCKW